MIMEPQKKTIAIADKGAGLADLIGEIAEGMGFEVRKMTVGMGTKPQDVASFVLGVLPDMVLLAENYLTISTAPEGLKYPDLKQGEGIEALAEIRGRGYTGPVYMISGSPQHEEEAMKQGANGYMPNTGNIKELEEFLKSAIG